MILRLAPRFVATAVVAATLPLTLIGTIGCGAKGADTALALVKIASAYKGGGDAGDNAIISPITGKPCPFITKEGPTELTTSLLSVLGGKGGSSTAPATTSQRPTATPASQSQAIEALRAELARRQTTTLADEAVIQEIEEGLRACSLDPRTHTEIVRRLRTDLTAAQRQQFLAIVRAEVGRRQQQQVVSAIRTHLAARRLDRRTEEEVLRRVAVLTPNQQNEFLRLLQTQRR